MRHGDWKLIVPRKGRPQLFNIADDPYEKSDMFASQPEVVSELTKLLADEQSKDQPKLPADLAGLPG